VDIRNVYYALGAALNVVDISCTLWAAVDITDISYTLGPAMDAVDISLNLGASLQPECQGPKEQLLWCKANILENQGAAR